MTTAPDNLLAIPVAALIGIPLHIRAETAFPIGLALAQKGTKNAVPEPETAYEEMGGMVTGGFRKNSNHRRYPERIRKDPSRRISQADIPAPVDSVEKHPQ